MLNVDQLKKDFIERTKRHIDLVNYFASKLNLSFPDHDGSKLTQLLDGYCYMIAPKEELTDEQKQLLDLCTFIHIRNTPHHPEYWTDTDLTGFTRDNYTPNGIIDATQMVEEYIVEMVCDWQACGKEYKNTCQDWFDMVNGTRWLFTQEQQNLIQELINLTNEG